MKKVLFGMMALAAMAGGCASEKQASTHGPVTPGALDLTPLPSAQPATSVATSAAAQPVQPVTPAVEQPVATPAATAGSSYTVQKGDTLYKIARDRYGDGKQWQKIAAANPGLSPATLKVGQKIAIP